MLKVGDALNLNLQLDDQAEDKFPLAYLFDADGADLPGSPVALTHLNRGLYIDNSFLMPETDEVKVQIIVYDDSSHLTQSDGYRLSLDVFKLGQSVDFKLALNLQLADGATDKYPVAYLFNADGTPFSTPTKALTHIIRGLYSDNSLDLAADVYAQFVIFDDAGLTIESGIAQELIMLQEAGESVDPGELFVQAGIEYVINGLNKTGLLNISGLMPRPYDIDQVVKDNSVITYKIKIPDEVIDEDAITAIVKDSARILARVRD